MASALARGLDMIGAATTWSRKTAAPFDEYDRIAVLSGWRHVGEALEWRSREPRTRVLVGPNVSILPSDLAEVDWTRADAVIVPSDWVAATYEADTPEIAGRIEVWTAGIDTSQWCPATGVERDLGIVYDKGLDEGLTRAAVAGVARAGLTPLVIRYGTYRPAHYLSALRRAAVMVWLSPSESQGIALLEAWAVGVPTLCADPVRWRASVAPPHLRNSSAAPYLTPANGAFVRDDDDIAAAVRAFVDQRAEFRPREDAIARFSLDRSARAFLEILDGPDPGRPRASRDFI